MNDHQLIIEVDLASHVHQEAVLELIDAYASDRLGNGKPLSPDVKSRLIDGLRNHPTTIIFIAMIEQDPVGIAVCFRGFSTFAAQPLINIHDLFVRRHVRGQGLATKLLAAVEQKGLELGCCKLTLEVLEYNEAARKIYNRFGFAQATYVKEAGGALFMSKPIAVRSSTP